MTASVTVSSRGGGAATGAAKAGGAQAKAGAAKAGGAQAKASGAQPKGKKALPKTGGAGDASPLALGAGVLLVGIGLLTRRIVG